MKGNIYNNTNMQDQQMLSSRSQHFRSQSLDMKNSILLMSLYRQKYSQ